MVAVVLATTLVGIDACLVEVECELARGLPQYNVVGLAATSVKEGAVRIRSALACAGHDLPSVRITVNLAPADLRKPGTALDLPIAAAVLLGEVLSNVDEEEADVITEGGYEYVGFERPENEIKNEKARGARRAKKARTAERMKAVLAGLVLLGELGLDGTVRPVRGVLASAMLVKQRGLRGVIVPEACAAEACVVDGIEVFAIAHVRELVDALAGVGELRRGKAGVGRARPLVSTDMADVRGQSAARAAIEVAVAGGHNLLLSGPPGTGKTMLARRIPTVLPPMTREEALETTKVYSALGLAHGLMEERPFRAPHHTISAPALLGGGSPPHPGEISLAHNGVLFLDEMPELPRQAVEGLRQPLEDRSVLIARVAGSIMLPASFLLVAAANPCPCGWLDSGMRECTCTPSSIERYRRHLSGPVLDRIDLQVHVPPVRITELRDPSPGESSAAIRDRVVAARERQTARLAPWRLHSNAEMPSTVMRATCRLDDAAERTLHRLVNSRRALTARAVDRMLRVARTIADLQGRDAIDASCLLEAAVYREPLPPPPILSSSTPVEETHV